MATEKANQQLLQKGQDTIKLIQLINCNCTACLHMELKKPHPD